MKTLKNLKILIPLILTTCCSCEIRENKSIQDENTSIQDRCLQRVVFKECMNSLPAGPVSTHYNDWDEVVEACENVAWNKSWRKRSVVKIECQAEN